MGKYYLSCPNCHARMRRTGKKVEEKEVLNYGEYVWLYMREYECPGCAAVWTYSEYRNMIVPGGIK